MVCLHNISPFAWKYLSYMHRVCKRCGKMEFLDTAYGLNPYWYNWLTADDHILKQSGVSFPQPKTAEGFISEAKTYNEEANKANREDQEEKLQEKLLRKQQQTKNIVLMMLYNRSTNIVC